MKPRPTCEPRPRPDAATLLEVALVFARLGVTSFGGPVAHIALMERDIVQRRRWIPAREFVDLMAATNLIPGPNSTEMALHIGYRRAGIPGLLVAGLGFIAPAAAIVLIVAAYYQRFAANPAIQGALSGIKPVVFAIIIQALIRLARTTLTTPIAAAIAIGSTILALFGVNELALLALGGISAAMLRRGAGGAMLTLIPIASLPTSSFGSLVGAAPVSPTLAGLFAIFLKIGGVLYGSGYVLIAFLRSDLVERRQWISESQLLDAIAIGQVTPGPLFTTATFIGYLLGGVSGAGIATIAIFLPAFILVALTAPWIERLRSSRLAASLMDGVGAASLALMAVASFEIARGSLSHPVAPLLAAVALSLLYLPRISSTGLIVAGGLFGYLFLSRPIAG